MLFIMKKDKKETKVFLYWHSSVTDVTGGGIYRLWFKNKYYIGRTRELKSRLRSHERDIQRRFEKNNGEPTSPLDFYQHVLRWIKEKNIKRGYMEIIERCYCDDDLVAAEQRWFDKCEFDKNCLNLGFVATPYHQKHGNWKKDKPDQPEKPPKKLAKNKLKILEQIKADSLKKRTAKTKTKKKKEDEKPLTSAQKLQKLKRELRKLEQEYSPKPRKE